MSVSATAIAALDNELSKRPLALDPGGYFIIYVDREAATICAKHFGNAIDDRGRAVDPETGKVIPAKGATQRQAEVLFQGRSAKELCIKVFEEAKPCPVTQLDHAAYLGREFVRAEQALLTETEYVQD